KSRTYPPRQHFRLSPARRPFPTHLRTPSPPPQPRSSHPFSVQRHLSTPNPLLIRRRNRQRWRHRKLFSRNPLLANRLQLKLQCYQSRRLSLRLVQSLLTEPLSSMISEEC